MKRPENFYQIVQRSRGLRREGDMCDEDRNTLLVYVYAGEHRLAEAEQSAFAAVFNTEKLESRLTEAEGMLRDARAFMPVEYQATVDALLNATKEDIHDDSQR